MDDTFAIIFFTIIMFLFMLAIATMYRQNAKEYWDELEKKKEQYDELYKKYTNLQEKLFELENNNNDDNNNDTDDIEDIHNNEDIKTCDVCGTCENVSYYPTDGFIGDSESKCYLSGGVYICEDCLKKCEVCNFCGKLVPAGGIENFINDVMKHPKFCSNTDFHKKIDKIKKHVMREKRGDKDE